MRDRSELRLFDSRGEVDKALCRYLGHAIAASSNKEFHEVFTQVEVCWRSGENVWIAGEKGTGKETLAKIIHYGNPGPKKPFFIFGHEVASNLEVSLASSGTATASILRSKPATELRFAQGGTFYLENMEAMSIESKLRLSRVIERLAARASRARNLRIVTASRDQERGHDRDEARGDQLFDQMSAMKICVPSLRERTEDIPRLAQLFLLEFATLIGKRVRTISKETMDLLVSYRWPGNVRELKNTVERGALSASGRTIAPGDVAGWLRGMGWPAVHTRPWATSAQAGLSLEEMKLEYISRVLQMCAGNKEKAARILGVTPVTIWRKLQRSRGGRRRKR